MTATMAEIREEVAVNPDAQSAVTDFLDYTEYLPTDLIRSLTLICQLDETYLSNSDSIHSLTQTYGRLPTLPSAERPDARQLRTTISRHLDLAINARESAYAEAVRLFDLTDRHQDRLKSIVAKLNALPRPSSRDSTPQPHDKSASKRGRNDKKTEPLVSTRRLTLKAPKGPIASAILPRPRHRRVTVPGEVQPAFDPDEPVASTEVSDWESDTQLPRKFVVDRNAPKPQKSRTVDGDRKSREPREGSTYRKPTPPPDDAPVGSVHKPWTHLSEYEMYKLRKKMKKNHTWEPSDIMITRELAEKGRGWDNYYKAKAAAEASGIPFIHIDRSKTQKAQVQAHTPAPSKVEAPKLVPKTEPAIRPKPPKRTDSRKEKRDEVPLDESAKAAQEAEQAARRLGDFSLNFRNLFSPFSSALASLKPTSTPPSSAPVKAESKSRKRKLEETKSASPLTEPEVQQKKKQKLLPKPPPVVAPEQPAQPPPSAGTIKIPPIKLNVNPQTHNVSAVSTPVSATRPVSAHRISSAAKIEPSPPVSRPPSQRSAAASVEPSTVPSTRASGRTSMTPVATTHRTPALETTPRAVATAASRRPKREPPGTITQSSQDGGVAVSISKRKHKPNKVNKTPAQKATETRTDEDGVMEVYDADEERYCICGDISYGDMILCELDEKCSGGQWFHMECVGLAEIPPRTVKWYCPVDRKKLHKGESTNGLVGRGIK